MVESDHKGSTGYIRKYFPRTKSKEKKKADTQSFIATEVATARTIVPKTNIAPSTPLGKEISEIRTLSKSNSNLLNYVELSSLLNIVKKQSYWIEFLDKAYKNAKMGLDKYCCEMYRLVK